jgi:hypothetical protein
MGGQHQIAQILSQTSIQAFFSHLAFLHPPIGANVVGAKERQQDG